MAAPSIKDCAFSILAFRPPDEAQADSAAAPDGSVEELDGSAALERLGEVALDALAARGGSRAVAALGARAESVAAPAGSLAAAPESLAGWAPVSFQVWVAQRCWDAAGLRLAARCSERVPLVAAASPVLGRGCIVLAGLGCIALLGRAATGRITGAGVIPLSAARGLGATKAAGRPPLAEANWARLAPDSLASCTCDVIGGACGAR